MPKTPASRALRAHWVRPNPYQERDVAKKALVVKANRTPKFKVRKYSRCHRCGRPRAYMRRFGLCRICFRQMALAGEIPGITKASW